MLRVNMCFGDESRIQAHGPWETRVSKDVSRCRKEQLWYSVFVKVLAGREVRHAPECPENEGDLLSLNELTGLLDCLWRAITVIEAD
jgi:hypothetical protein